MNERSTLHRLPASLKVVLFAVVLYLFLVGIGAMGASFKMMGEEHTRKLLGSQASPLVSLFIGILATTLVQSSSTTTSIVVGMVAAGAIPFHSAAFMIMGANVGTTVTNTIVSLGHLTRSREYERAFAAATVHDFFNVLVLSILFPLEWSTSILSRFAEAATSLFEGAGGTRLANPLKAVTKPSIEALKDLAEWMGGGGVLLLVIALVITFVTLVGMVKTMRSLMATKLEIFFDRVLFKSPIRSLCFGIVLTALVQSSSITTSVAVPLVGAGILHIRQVFPYTMGANIGTTVTALLASMAALAAAGAGDRETALLGVQLAFFHVSFNMIGVLLFWRFRSLPIWIAESFARLALRNRMIPVLYIVLAFYVVPLIIIWLGR